MVVKVENSNDLVFNYLKIRQINDLKTDLDKKFSRFHIHLQVILFRAKSLAYKKITNLIEFSKDALWSLKDVNTLLKPHGCPKVTPNHFSIKEMDNAVWHKSKILEKPSIVN